MTSSHASHASPAPTEEAVVVDGPRGTLRGMRHRARGERRATAIVLQGYFSCTHVGPTRLYVEMGRALAKLGVEMWRVGPYGTGDSDGDFADTTYETQLADHRAVIAHARAASPAPLWLIGHSLGAGYALRIACGDGDGGGGVDVARNIIVSPSFGRSSIYTDAQRAEMRAGGRSLRKGVVIRGDFVEAMEADVVEIARRVRVPTTFFYGTRDEFYPRSAIDPVVAAMPNASLITIDGADHNYMTPATRQALLQALVKSASM